MELIEANWPLLLVAFLIGLALAFFLFNASRRTRVTGEVGDVLDEGAPPAARNQALIDSGPVAAAPPASVEPIQPAERLDVPQPVVPPTPAGLAGIGAVISTATTTTTSDDDFTRIKGIGPKLAARLGELGVTGFAEIAAWDEAAIDRIDAELGRFQGRIRRDDWVEQARLLANGDTLGYETRFGRLD